MTDPVRPGPDLSFLAPPGQVADWRATVLLDAVLSTGVLDALPGTVEQVASRAGVDSHALRVVLDALAALGPVHRSDGGVYEQAAEAPDRPTAATIAHHARALRRWATTAEGALRGDAGAAVGPPVDPETFHDALAANARKSAPEVVDACLARFPGATSVLDLGGLHGEYSLEFTRRGLKATMQDRAAMIEVARRRGRLEAAGVELFAGDFFEAVPPGPFDLAFCSGITHTFDGAANLTLWRNLRPVVATGGGVAVVTFLRNANPVTDLFAVQMLLNANGGDTHTEAEYRQWLGQAGFQVDDEVVDLPGPGARSVLFAH